MPLNVVLSEIPGFKEVIVPPKIFRLEKDIFISETGALVLFKIAN